MSERSSLIFCILPDSGAQLYSQIKNITDMELGIASQCVVGKHVKNPKDQYCSNVVLKINAKLGGINTKVIILKYLFLNLNVVNPWIVLFI